MTDRELLELAAKAAGYEVRWHEPWECFVHTDPLNIDNPPTLAGQRMLWTPLTDDGDALRLAVKLGMDVCFGANYVIVRGSVQMPTVRNDGDPYAATRRAIVRAAAEIGRSLAPAVPT